jgi:hypothetical protein
MTTVESTTERRALLERRAVRMVRLERLVEAIGRRRASTAREATLGAKVAGVAIAVAAIVMSVMYLRRRATHSPLVHRLAQTLARLA